MSLTVRWTARKKDCIDVSKPWPPLVLLKHFAQCFTSENTVAALLGSPFTPGVGMLIEKVPQRHEQLRRMLDSTLVECFVNIVDDHCSDDFAAMRLVQQIAGERGGSYFRDVLMFTDGGNLVLIEAAKVHAILQ
jgi:hypothetical protein